MAMFTEKAIDDFLASLLQDPLFLRPDDGL
jgi:hypothetical protein